MLALHDSFHQDPYPALPPVLQDLERYLLCECAASQIDHTKVYLGSQEKTELQTVSGASAVYIEGRAVANVRRFVLGGWRSRRTEMEHLGRIWTRQNRGLRQLGSLAAGGVSGGVVWRRKRSMG